MGDTNKNKGFGFLECSSADFADRLTISENQFHLNGKKMGLKKAEPKGDVGADRGNRGGRGRGGSFGGRGGGSFGGQGNGYGNGNNYNNGGYSTGYPGYGNNNMGYNNYQ